MMHKNTDHHNSFSEDSNDPVEEDFQARYLRNIEQQRNIVANMNVNQGLQKESCSDSSTEEVQGYLVGKGRMDRNNNKGNLSNEAFLLIDKKPRKRESVDTLPQLKKHCISDNDSDNVEKPLQPLQSQVSNSVGQLVPSAPANINIGYMMNTMQKSQIVVETSQTSLVTLENGQNKGGNEKREVTDIGSITKANSVYSCSLCCAKTNSLREMNAHSDDHSLVQTFQCGVCVEQIEGLQLYIAHFSKHGIKRYCACSKCVLAQLGIEYVNKYLPNQNCTLKPCCVHCEEKFEIHGVLYDHIKEKHGSSITENVPPDPNPQKELNLSEDLDKDKSDNFIDDRSNVNKSNNLELEKTLQIIDEKPEQQNEIKELDDSQTVQSNAADVKMADDQAHKTPSQKSEDKPKPIKKQSEKKIKNPDDKKVVRKSKEGNQKPFPRRVAGMQQLAPTEKDKETMLESPSLQNNPQHEMTVCKVCNKVLAKRGLRYHMDKHNNGKPYKCETCNRTFKHRNSIYIHVRTQHKPQFTCKVCNKSLADDLALVMHVAENHPEDNSPEPATK